MLESVLLCFLGGVLGCLATLPFNGLSTGTANWATFSEITFEFRFGLDVLWRGVLMAIVMGVFGGLFPRRPRGPHADCRCPASELETTRPTNHLFQSARKVQVPGRRTLKRSKSRSAVRDAPIRIADYFDTPSSGTLNAWVGVSKCVYLGESR